MKVRQIMTSPAIGIHREESVEVAARTLAQYNIGALPVWDNEERVCGMVTDRDLVTRCLAANRSPAQTKVGEIMTGQVQSVKPDADASEAARIMGKEQLRRLPVMENGRLYGIVSLGDVAGTQDGVPEAAQALTQITRGVSER